MDFLKTQFERLQQQLGALNASQKMLAGSLLVIMIMTLFWWSGFAGRSEMEAVLDQPMSAEDIAQITMQLSAKNIPHKVVGDRVHVSADRRFEALAVMSYMQLMPRDTSNAFDEMSKRAGPFITQGQQEAMLNELKQQELTQIIRHFPNVSRAHVLIDARERRGINGARSSATINISMRSGQQATPQLVNGAAELVAGAVATLAPGDVKVIIDGVYQKVRGGADSHAGSSDEYLATVQKAERYYVDQVARHFSYIEGAMISVRVKPNFSTQKKVLHDVDPKNVIYKPVVEVAETEQTTAAFRNGGEPGVIPNTPTAIGSAEPSGGESTSAALEKNRTEHFIDSGYANTTISDPGGNLTVTTASVLVPRSYFKEIFKSRTNTAETEPDPTVLDAFIGDQLVKMRQTVQRTLGLAGDDSVHVDSYTDLMPAASMAPQAAASPIALLFTDHKKEIAVGALAVLSLFMLSNMVKRTSPAPAAVHAESVRSTVPLAGGEESIGEASEGSPFLDGMELDDDSIKAHQMLAQVSEMVDENPDGAANLVNRWLNRS